MLRRFNDYDLSRHNTFRMRVRCACYIEYDSSRDLEEIDFGGLPQPVINIGCGSNLLFTRDFPGTVLHSAVKQFSVESSGEDSMQVEVGAGVELDDFCSWACDNGLWGIENLSGIPGEIGAAAVQNVGAYGVEIKDVVSCVKCYDIIGRRTEVLTTSQCGYGYRDSIFKHAPAKERYIVVSVLFQLGKVCDPKTGYGGLASRFQPGSTPTLEQIRKAVLEIRSAKLPDPDELGSAGSFFTNPVVPADAFRRICQTAMAEGAGVPPHYDMADGMVKIPAAWLIDNCGYRGAQEGGAAVYDKQPLVIVNRSGDAKAEDILTLAGRITDGVYAKYGIRLAMEVETV